MHGFLRRLFVYPEFTGRISAVSSAADVHRSSPDLNARYTITHGRDNTTARAGGRTSEQHTHTRSLQREMLQMCDGNHNTDEICSRFMVSYTQLEACLREVSVEGTGEVFMTCNGAVM